MKATFHLGDDIQLSRDGVKSAAHYCVPRGRYKIADGRVIDCCLCANYHELIIPAEVPAGE